MNILNRSLIKKVFSNHILKLQAGGINFLMIALIARVTNSDILGEFTAVYAAIILVSSFTFWGLADGFILLGKRFQLEILFANSVAVIFINWLFSSFVVFVLFWNYDISTKLLMISIVFSFLIHNLFSALLRFIEKYKSSIYFNSIEVNGLFILSIITGVLLELTIDVKTLLLMYTASHLVSILICFIYVFATSSFKLEFVRINAISKKDMISIYRHNGPLLISDIMNNFIGSIDILILNRFLSFSDIGSYKVASTFGKLIKISLSSFANFMLPELSKMIASSSKGIHDYITSNHKYIFIIAIGLITSIILLGDIAIDMIFGSEYQISYFFLLGLLIGYSFNNFSGPNGTIILALGKLRTLLMIDIITNLTGVVALFVLTWKFGLWGSIAANVIMLLLYNVLKNIYASRFLDSYRQITKRIFVVWIIVSIFITVVFYLKF